MKLSNIIATVLGFIIGLPKQAIATGSYVAEKTRVKVALDDINRELSRPERLSEERRLELEFAKEAAEELLKEGEGENSPAPGFAERLKNFKIPMPQRKDPVNVVQGMTVKK